VNTQHCCEIQARAGDNARRPASRWGRGGEIAGWILPTVTLALLPKCPACVAAYVVLATGIGISLPAAAHLRVMLVVLCAASLVFITARRLRSLFLQGVSQSPTPKGIGSNFGLSTASGRRF
jgi:hypothetical protein